MDHKHTLLISGVSGYWGKRVAEAMLSLPELHVIGLDIERPDKELKGLDFIQADIRNPLILDLLKDEGIDFVYHLSFRESDRPSEMIFDSNVMGTMKLFGACAEAGVKNIIVKSSTSVYGAHADNSAFLREDQPLRGSRTSGSNKDYLEIEAFCNGFRNQYPTTALTILRFANIVGPSSHSPLNNFLGDSRYPVLLGFDPMMQIIYEEDVINALVHAFVHRRPGTFNVAAEGVLPLLRLMALAGKPPIPILHLCAYRGSGVLSNLGGVGRWPIEPDYLRYPCVADLGKMREELQFEPRYSAVEALQEFTAIKRAGKFSPTSTSAALDEEHLRATLERRKRDRERQSGINVNLGEAN